MIPSPPAFDLSPEAVQTKAIREDVRVSGYLHRCSHYWQANPHLSQKSGRKDRKGGKNIALAIPPWTTGMRIPRAFVSSVTIGILATLDRRERERRIERSSRAKGEREESGYYHYRVGHRGRRWGAALPSFASAFRSQALCSVPAILCRRKYRRTDCLRARAVAFRRRARDVDVGEQKMRKLRRNQRLIFLFFFSRKAKCDEARPKCSRCSRLGEECLYPAWAPLELVRPTSPSEPITFVFFFTQANILI
jgi:hypothetical protein